ncbi:MAG: hypothetical protein J6A01_04995 [Proteobacteria bacterium]|nr:hypothetical protein [Pseudomonadota bacterium]
MSNDRHLTIDDGTMGNLFRRVTLASLGLDSMEGVSEQSYEVIDRADSFAARLMGGVSSVMPKIDSERLGLNATSLSDHLLEGMSGLNGPKSATDLGDWQYWLDAALLMLFDEDDEEEASLSNRSATRTNATQSKVQRASAVTPEAIRARVAALRNSGIKPAMLQSMPQAAKRAFVEDLKKASESKHEGNDVTFVNAKEVAETLSKTLSMAAEKRFGNSYNSNSISAVEKILATNTRQTFASHIADKAAMVSAQINQAGMQSNSEVQSLTDRWTRSLSTIGTHADSNVSSMREMLSALDGLEKAGAIQSEQAAALRRASKAYAHRVLAEEISHDALAVASRMENMVKAANERSALISQRAMTFADSTDKRDFAESFKKSFATLSQRLGEFNQAVSSRVDVEGESAATVRWSRAADRFERLQGVSDDIDRVLLRDVVESAVELSNVGIIPQSLVQSIVSASSQVQRAVSTDKAIQTISASKLSDGAGNHNLHDVFAQIGNTRILGNLASKIESSVDNLVKDLARSGISGSSVDNFVSDIRQLVATGTQANTSNSSRASSVIESICARLDDFAQIAASTVVMHGYDDVATETEGTFVSATEAEGTSSASAQMQPAGNSVRANLAQIQALQASLSNAKNEAQQQAQNFIRQQQSARAAMAEAEQKILDNAVATASLESLVQAQKALAPHMTNEAQAQLARTVASIQRSQAHLENVAQQVKLIENTVKISESLRNASRTGAISASPAVAMDNLRIHSDYLTALGGTLNTVARLRTEMAATKSEALASNISENRLERMLSLVTPVNHEVSGVRYVSEVSKAEDIISAMNHTETSIGYDEVVPSSLEWVRQAEQYPSQSSVSDLTSMLGVRKAAELHATDIVNGRAESVQSLVSSITKLVSEQKFASHPSASIQAYSMSEDGDHVKVSVGVQPNRNVSQSFALRNNTVESYQPVNARQPQMSSIAAALDMTKLAGEGTISGADTFMPLIAGANTSNQASGTENVSSSIAPEVQAQRGREAVQAILARFGIQSTRSSENAVDGERFRLNVGGVDFDMSANAFVQMVAKPAMTSAAVSMPATMDANNALFAGYASLLNAQGEKRTLKALRQSYVETLAKAGAMSAHSQVGFSTQSFADIMGVTPTFVNASATSAPASSAVAQARRDVTAQTSDLDESFVNELISRTESVQSGELSGDASYAWVSNQLRANASASNNGVSSQHDEHNSQQLLGRIDSMLDYVESMSERNVGVFSSDDTVRVLLEALPASSSLGNKGLPKWRQRDTKATRMAEARELREALAKIGASPVQGVSRFANKQYVSPNLLQNQSTGTAPLFSGGSDTSMTPGASSSISKAADKPSTSDEITDEDLEFIAEQVFRKIEESLNDEQQRRRSE